MSVCPGGATEFGRGRQPAVNGPKEQRSRGAATAHHLAPSAAAPRLHGIFAATYRGLAPTAKLPAPLRGGTTQTHDLYRLDYPPFTSDFVTDAKVGSIPEGQGATHVVNGRLVAVFCVQGEYFAIDDTCPHMGASLGAGEVHDGVVTCPWHAWRFSVCDGTWRDNPKLKIDRFEVRVEGDEIQVCVPERIPRKQV